MGIKMNFKSQYKPLLEFHKIEKFDYNGEQNKLKILRNLVDYEVGKTILATAFNIQIAEKDTQTKLF